MKSFHLLMIMVVAIAFTASTKSADAAIILSNTFDGNVPGNTDPISAGQVVDPNVTSPGVSRPGHTLNGGFNELVAGELRTFGSNIDTANRYFGFSISAVGGAEIDFEDFVYTGSVDLNDGTVNPDKLGFRSSLDGFTNDIGTVTIAGTTIDLSGSQFQNVTSPIEFRLYTQIGTDFSADGSSSGTTFSLNDFAFNGTVVTAVAVPEPSSLAVLAVGGIYAVARRRRKTQA